MDKLIKALPDLLVIAGVAAIALGAGMVYLPAGFIVGGVLVVGMGVVASKKLESKAPE